MQLPHHSRATQPQSDFVTPISKPLRHDVAGAKFLKADFRMLVQVSAQRGECLRAGLHRFQDRQHGVTAAQD